MTYNKEATMRWRASHKEQYNEQMKTYQKEHYKERYETHVKEHKKQYYKWKKQTQILLDMLNNLFPL